MTINQFSNKDWKNLKQKLMIHKTSQSYNDWKAWSNLTLLLEHTKTFFLVLFQLSFNSMMYCTMSFNFHHKWTIALMKTKVGSFGFHNAQKAHNYSMLFLLCPRFVCVKKLLIASSILSLNQFLKLPWLSQKVVKTVTWKIKGKTKERPKDM